MKGKLPVASAKKLIKALHKIGYEPHHQKGSYITLKNKKEAHDRVVVPNHKEIARETLRAILDDVELTVKEFNKLI